MFWTYALWYVMFALLVVAPIFVKYFYEAEKAEHYEADGVTPKMKKVKGRDEYGRKTDYAGNVRWTEEEIQEDAWDEGGVIFGSVLLASIWPATLYYYALKYLAKHAEYKANRKKRKQLQDQLALDNARAIVEEHRKQRELDQQRDEKLYDMAFVTAENKAEKMERELR